MGYMGFGMKKEVYTRKPKNPFVKIKKLFDKELVKRKKYTLRKATKEEVEDLQARKEKQERDSKNSRILFALFVTVIFILTAYYFKGSKESSSFSRQKTIYKIEYGRIHHTETEVLGSKKVIFSYSRLNKLIKRDDYESNILVSSTYFYKSGISKAKIWLDTKNLYRIISFYPSGKYHIIGDGFLVTEKSGKRKVYFKKTGHWIELDETGYSMNFQDY